MDDDAPEWWRYHTEGVAEYVLTLFPSNFKGICVDVGAYASKWISNSYLLEQSGWLAFCIEPNPHCAELLKERANVFPYAICAENKDCVKFFAYGGGEGLPPYKEAGGSSLKYKEGMDHRLSLVTEVNLRTLDWFLEQEAKVDHLDFLAIDTEGTEMDVLLGIDLLRWSVKVICIENFCGWVTEQQQGYLSQLGYEKIHRLVHNDIYRKVE